MAQIGYVAALFLFLGTGCTEGHMVTGIGRPAGLAEMSADGTLTVHMFATQGGDIVETYTPDNPNYEAARTIVGGISPGERKDIPRFVGRVDMALDGTITYTELGTATDGAQVDGGAEVVRPGQPRYEQILSLVGILKPGEFKMVQAKP